MNRIGHSGPDVKKAFDAAFADLVKQEGTRQ